MKAPKLCKNRTENAKLLKICVTVGKLCENWPKIFKEPRNYVKVEWKNKKNVEREENWWNNVQLEQKQQNYPKKIGKM